MHNGGIDDDIKEALYTELGGASWFMSSNHPSNWNTNTGQYNQFIDSEILFHWIMSNIMDNGGDVLSGIHDALTATIDDGNIDLEYEFRNPEATWHNVINFILTDGETLYVFRNAFDSWSHHYLSWEENDNNCYTVKTQAELENGLNQFDLVKISRDNEPITYENFFDLDIIVFASGYNWESFPRIGTEPNGNVATDLVNVLNDIEPFEGSITNINMQADETIPFELTYDYLATPQWDPDAYPAQSSWLYKIEILPGEDRLLTVDGDRLPADFTLEDEDPLEANTYHWLGFWLPQTQKMIESFGDYWQYVEKVKSEDWYYNKCSIIRGGDPYGGEVVISAEGLTLEYGKGYMVWFKDLPQPISDFHWTLDNTVEEPIKKVEPENFTYTEKADYEAIDVFNIPPDVTEIGVYEDDVCVGAVAVEDTCAQILVYSDNANRDPIPFTFEIVTGRGLSTPVKDYQVIDPQTGKYENKSIFSGRQEYSIMRFADEDEPENIVSKPVLKGNYPNPFNPTTTISFSLPNEQEIELTIFNIKGQKVKTLYSGIADEGEHSITWSGKDVNNKSVSSGLYFYKLKTNNNTLTRKMIMMK